MHQMIVPMAGHGSRFGQRYNVPKPLIDIAGKPMVAQAALALPAADRYVFVCRKDHCRQHPTMEQKIRDAMAPNECKFVYIDETTRGLIFTTEIGIIEGGVSPEDTVTVTCCDNGVVYDRQMCASAMAAPNVDVWVWGVRYNPSTCVKPTAWEWVKVATDSKRVERVGIKEPVSDNPYFDPMLVGTFRFASAGIYLEAMEAMHEAAARESHEFYGGHLINHMIDKGYNCRLMPADLYVSWGYPEQLDHYNRWREWFEHVGI